MKKKPSYEELVERIQELEQREIKRRHIQENLREKAAAMLQQGIPECLPETLDSIDKLVNELQLYQVELEMQNDELRVAQQELQRSRDHFFNLFDKAPIGYAILDQNGMIMDINQAIIEMVGQDRERILGKPFSQFIISQDQPIFLSRFKAFFKSPQGKTISIRIEDHRGNQRDVELNGRHGLGDGTAAPVKESQNVQNTLLISILDVTRQKESLQREAHIKKVLTAIRKVDQLIVNATDPTKLMQEACEALTENMGYFNSWIVWLDETQQLTLSASSGFTDELKHLQEDIYQGKMPQCIAHAMEQEGVVVAQDPSMECLECPMVNQYSGQSALTRRLSNDGIVLGAITVAVPKLYASDPEEHVLFEEVADDLQYALQKLELDVQLHRFSHIFDTIPHPISFISRDYRYRAINRAYQEFYPVDRQEIIGKMPADFCSEEVFNKDIKPHLDRAFSGEMVNYEVEVDFPGKKGRAWMEMSYFPYRDAKGRIKGVVTHGLEITQLKQSEKRLRTILEGTPLGVCITDSNGVFEYVNPAYCQLYKYRSDELIGKPFTLVVPEANRQFLTDLHDAFIRGDEELRGEWQVQDKNGRAISIMADASRIIGVDGKPRKVTFVMDITSKNELEQLKGDVDRMMRHDLKQPLNAIMGFPYVLESKGNLDAVQLKSVRMIKEAGETMLKMIDASLDMFKMEQGSYDYQPTELNLMDVLFRVMEGYLSLMRMKKIQHSIWLNGLLAKTDQPLMIRSERHLLISLISNLMVNAIEASSVEDEVRIEVTTVPPFIMIAIHNKGAVPQPIRNKFFDKYQTYGKKKGTGLGTYSAKLMVDVMGYDIAMETSEKQNHTTIRITIDQSKI